MPFYVVAGYGTGIASLKVVAQKMDISAEVL